LAATTCGDDILTHDRALNDLARIEAAAEPLMRSSRFFGPGSTPPETAAALRGGVGERATILRDWRVARAWSLCTTSSKPAGRRSAEGFTWTPRLWQRIRAVFGRRRICPAADQRARSCRTQGGDATLMADVRQRARRRCARRLVAIAIFSAWRTMAHRVLTAPGFRDDRPSASNGATGVLGEGGMGVVSRQTRRPAERRRHQDSARCMADRACSPRPLRRRARTTLRGGSESPVDPARLSRRRATRICPAIPVRHAVVAKSRGVRRCGASITA
jgi:hypothetical protein